MGRSTKRRPRPEAGPWDPCRNMSFGGGSSGGGRPSLVRVFVTVITDDGVRMQEDLARDQSQRLDPDSGDTRCADFLQQPLQLPSEFGKPLRMCHVPRRRDAVGRRVYSRVLDDNSGDRCCRDLRIHLHASGRVRRHHPSRLFVAHTQ